MGKREKQRFNIEDLMAMPRKRCGILKLKLKVFFLKYI